MILGQHILTSFDKDLKKLNSNVIKMTELVINALHMTLSLLKDNKQEELFTKIAEQEVQINQLNQDTLDLCLAIFTLRSPVASDLRYVFATSNMCKILEQNGDSIKNVIIKDLPGILSQNSDLDSLIVQMLEQLINIHNKALNALIKKDPEIAELASFNDSKIRESFSNLCNLLLQKIQKEPGKLSSFYNYIFLGKSLETMAGRVDNIRKLINFIKNGKFETKYSQKQII